MNFSLASAALGRVFQRHPTPSDEELAAYAADLRPILDRAERIYREWLEQTARFPEAEDLANGASIHRWVAATMVRTLDQVDPLPALVKPHVALTEALDLARRASQLLSNGSRFHNARAMCDGQTLLEESRKRRHTAAASIERYLQRHGVPPPEPSPAEPLSFDGVSRLVPAGRPSPPGPA